MRGRRRRHGAATRAEICTASSSIWTTLWRWARMLYLTPIFQAASNHRYNTHDYYQVDPLLGGLSAFRELLEACHAHGLRVILDGVFNHAGRGFFPFHDLLENGPHSAYHDWFHIHRFPLNAYQPQQGLGY